VINASKYALSAILQIKTGLLSCNPRLQVFPRLSMINKQLIPQIMYVRAFGIKILRLGNGTTLNKI
jgi:hypothetical protein